MTVTFLGTGTSTGIPFIGSNHPVCLSKDFRDKRLRSSIRIDIEKKTFIIDCGPDFRQQMINSNCKKIDAIFFTHEHSDHTAGLDDIRPFCFRDGKIPIYAHQRVINNLSTRFSYIFKEDNKYPGSPSIKTNFGLIGNLSIALFIESKAACRIFKFNISSTVATPIA